MWTQLLDRAHSLAQLAELEADPAAVATALATELPPVTSLDTLAARDAMLVDAVHKIDATIARAMRIQLEHALADDATIGAPTRNVFATTIGRYVNDLGLLEERARDAAARGGSLNPNSVADRVLGAARATFALREALLGPIFTAIIEHGRSIAKIADTHARDRKLAEPQRKQWSAARRDLEAIAANPTHLFGGAWAERIARFEPQIDEPEPEREPTLAELIELD